MAVSGILVITVAMLFAQCLTMVHGNATLLTAKAVFHKEVGNLFRQVTIRRINCERVRAKRIFCVTVALMSNSYAAISSY